MSFNWTGDALQARVITACKAGIDETMAACVSDAKQNYYEGHGLITTMLQGSIMLRPAEERAGAVVGQWGSFDVNYARYVEEGTGRMTGQGQLQGAADKEYPKLAARIRKRLR